MLALFEVGGDGVEEVDELCYAQTFADHLPSDSPIAWPTMTASLQPRRAAKTCDALNADFEGKRVLGYELLF